MTLPAPPSRTAAAVLPAHVRSVANPRGYHYLVSSPPAEDSKTIRRWPLILFLHGAAERGNRVEDVTRQGLPKLIAAHPELTPAEAVVGHDVSRRFIVVAPQCPPFEIWEERLLLELLDEVNRTCPVDATRVYLTGLSMGAFGAWSLGIRHPEKFAALAPVCGGGRISDVHGAQKNQPAALHTLGIWAFHGARDRIVPIEESERMIEGVRAAGVQDVQFTVYAEAEHDSWTPSYANPELYRWMLKHTR